MPVRNKVAADQKARISGSNLIAFSYCAVTARLFFLIAVDTPSSLNAVLIQLLLGALYSFPAVFSSYFLLKKYGGSLLCGVSDALGSGMCRILLFAFGLMFLYESACVIRMLTSSAEYATLYDAHSPMLLIPTSLAIIYTVLKGGNGAGGAALIFVRAAFVLIAVICLIEFRDMDIKRVFPVMGPGLQTLHKNAVHTVLYFCMLPMAYFLKAQDANKREPKSVFHKPCGIILLYAACVLTTAFLLFVTVVSAPEIPNLPESRGLQMNMLLANGRSSRGIQLPILILWFSGIFVSAVFMLYMACSLVKAAFGTDGKWVELLFGAVAALLALFRLSLKEDALAFSAYAGFPVLFVITSLPVILQIRKRFGGKH